MASKSKKSKIKNLIITIIEILVVAGILYGAMTFVLNKIDKDADVATKKEVKEEKGTGNYSIQVNLAKNAMIIYEIAEDKTETAVKVFPVSVGDKLQKGKYSINEKYPWVRIGDNWSQYSCKIDGLSYIGSTSYNDKYPQTLNRKSYNNIGVKKANGKSILLYAGDANWIYENCKIGTKINIIKGKVEDTLPMAIATKVELATNCDWDPTDPNEKNPYINAKNGTIAMGAETIYIEKDTKVDYLANFLVLDNDGTDITSQLSYNKIKTDELGKKEINYTVTTSDGKTVATTQKIEIVDTTCPIVTCSRDYFTYQVDGRGTSDMNTETNVEAIEKMVRNYVSVNESGCKITVRTVNPTELMEGEFPVVIKAQDESGNVGSYQVTCNITVKKAVITDKNTPSNKIDKLEEERKKQNKANKKANKKDAKEE